MRFTQQDIVKYYDDTEVDYKIIWKLKKGLALHYGYWDDTTKNLVQALLRENQILADQVGITKRDIVLDAGCGVGGSSIYLAKHYGCKVIGITLSQRQVIEAQRNAQRHHVENLTEFYKMDYTKTSFKDKSFTVVCAIESFCIAKNKEKLTHEVYRLLKKGGKLIIADAFAAKEQYTDKEKKIMEQWMQGWIFHPLETEYQTIQRLKQIGFRKISFLDVTQHIEPSSKLLYLHSFPAMFFGTIAEFMKIRNKVQTGNIRGARAQYIALRQNLWKYGFLFAEK